MEQERVLITFTSSLSLFLSGSEEIVSLFVSMQNVYVCELCLFHGSCGRLVDGIVKNVVQRISKIQFLSPPPLLVLLRYLTLLWIYTLNCGDKASLFRHYYHLFFGFFLIFLDCFDTKEVVCNISPLNFVYISLIGFKFLYCA